jgi:hypothetical protein
MNIVDAASYRILGKSGQMSLLRIERKGEQKPTTKGELIQYSQKRCGKNSGQKTAYSSRKQHFQKNYFEKDQKSP